MVMETPQPIVPTVDSVRAGAKIAADTLDQMYDRKIMLPVDTVKELKGTVSSAGRLDQAMERGWEPWTRPDNIVMGLVEKIASPVDKLNMPFFLSLAAVAVMVIVEVFMRFSGWSAFTFAIPVVLVIVGVTMADRHQARLRELRDTDRNIRDRSEDHYIPDTIRIYSGLIPVAFYEKYLADKHLFDRTYIASFNKAHFTTQVVPALHLDPFLVGRIGDLFFLGGHWGMGEELEQAEMLSDENQG